MMNSTPGGMVSSLMILLWCGSSSWLHASSTTTYAPMDTVPGSVTSGPWTMHRIDPLSPAGSDGVKLADVNGDGFLDIATGFEEDGISRIYLHPGNGNVREAWKCVSLPSPDVEDAVPIDLDQDGMIDLVTASEGSGNRITFHWAPDKATDYLDSSKWRSEAVPAVDGLSAWMFVVPADMDGINGIDLVIGSKRKSGENGDDLAWVGWLRSPDHPRAIRDWKFYPLTRAGWIMSVRMVDINHDGDQDVLLSDRKFSTQKGVRWLENPGVKSKTFYAEWKSHMLGVTDGEPMFLDMADLDGDGADEILVPDCYAGLKILRHTGDVTDRWNTHSIPYPSWAGPRGKAVAIEDIDMNGSPDVVLSFEEEGSVASLPYEAYRKTGRYSVVLARVPPKPFAPPWAFSKISGLRGRKFDLVNLLDLDGDGDVDVLTNDENEEGDGMGVIWYENRLRD